MNESDNLLITAMMLLECHLMSKDDRASPEDHESMLWAVHELIQRAWGLSSGNDEAHEISNDTNILISTLHSLHAIQNAVDSSARGAI